jgi:citrate lyase beta subunit
VREGRGAVALDGRMVDLAVVRRAQRLLAEAGSHEDPRRRDKPEEEVVVVCE